MACCGSCSIFNFADKTATSFFLDVSPGSDQVKGMIRKINLKKKTKKEELNRHTAK